MLAKTAPAAVPLPRIGAHVSAAGGLMQVLPRARSIGAEVVQIFPSNPRQWRGPIHALEDRARFRNALRRAGLSLFVHTIYLINLASPDQRLRERSASALADALVFGAQVGSDGVVTHIGSHRGTSFEEGLGRVTVAVAQAITQATGALAGASGSQSVSLPPLRLESSAGSADSIGKSPAELGRILGELPADAGVCLDTAHLFAAGYPIHTADGLAGFLAELDRHIGLYRVGPIHLNDSKSALGSGSDRHEDLWEGKIGRTGLAGWVRHPAFRHIGFVLETPGFDRKGPDRKNLRRAKRMRTEE